MNNIYTLLILILLTLNLTSLNASRLLTDSVLSVTDSIDETPLPFAEEMAYFPGGTTAMIEFLSKNIRYLESATRNGISGKVFVQFVVDKEGNILRPKILKGIDSECDEEAIRLIKMFPKWIPAKDKGIPVSVYYTLPIRFYVQEEPLTFVEQMPEFPGGMDAFLKFMYDSIKFPVNGQVEGREIVQFIVNKNGKISNIEIVRSLGPEYDSESVRLIKSFPDWIPGQQNGNLCAVYYTLPILFLKDKKDFKFIKDNHVFNEITTTECSFPGGMDSLSLFVGHHLRYPKDAEEKNIKGVVRVSFKVDKEGKLIRPHVTHKLFPSLDQEALRVVNLMPEWIPATRNHKTVISNYTLEFSFGIDPTPIKPKSNYFESVFLPVNKCDTSSLSKYDTISLTQDGKVPLAFVEQMPQFPGGQDALLYFLANNIKYPAAAVESNISGRVVLQFVVTETGDITNIRVVRGIGGGCDEEAVRVVRMMPRWKPGYHDGFPVPVFYTLPVLFTLKDEIALPSPMQ